jgi:hypothetical protein
MDRICLTTVVGLLGLAFSLQAAEPTFPKEGTAFLQKHCLSCHGEKKQRGDIALHTFKDDASLLKNRKLWQSILRVVKAGEMPPEEKPRPATPELEAFLKSVNMVFDQADAKAKPDPGRVVTRRLNRTEFNNTVRDLVYVDFNAGDDFPSDEVGYGFDNIGDVLSLPPILMERYLAASDSIMKRAIFVDLPKPIERWMGSQFSEPAAAKVPLEENWRKMTTKKGATHLEAGPIHVPYAAPSDGEYLFKTKLFKRAEKDTVVKVAILAVGKNVSNPVKDADLAQFGNEHIKNLRPFSILKIQELKAEAKDKSEIIQLKLEPNIDFERIAIAVLKPENGKDAEVLVDFFYLQGPMDTRPTSHKKLLACDTKKAKPEQTREILERFLNRAYRRPATKEEIDRSVKLAELTEKETGKWEAGIQLAMQAVLVSPKFLFRIEANGKPDSIDPVPLDQYQLATRMSYFIWASMPDDQLFDLAKQGNLIENLEPQVKRMLKDPKAKSLVESFVMQWLQLKRLSTVAPDQKLFPNFNEELRQSMAMETQLFFEELIREDRSLLDIIDGHYTYLNGKLSGLYGIADTTGADWNNRLKKPGAKEIPWDRFVRVELPADHIRAGVLTHASLLTTTSNPTRTSPVKRGKFILEQILGTPPPAPPPNVPELPNDAKAITAASLRQRMEEHRKNPACANCHTKMDAIGFAFENMNAIGGFRWKDGNFDIDASGKFPDGRSFKGAAELRKVLLDQKDEVARAVAEKMLIYAIGRGTEYYDKRALDQIVAKSRGSNYRFSSVVLEIINSDPFRLRRGKEQVSND